MPEPLAPTDPDFDPRHRVAGAVILVLLAVVFLPMILDDEPATGPAPAPLLPEREAVEAEDAERVFVSRVTPVETDAPVTALPPPEPAPAAPARELQSPKPAGAKKEKKEPRGKTAQEGNKKGSATPARGSWLVRVGTFSRPANARRVVAKLKAEGYAPRTGVIDTAKGKATRVWVGPFSSRRAAARAQQRIRREAGLDGLIVAAP